jgi:hypothetical protein
MIEPPSLSKIAKILFKITVSLNSQGPLNHPK